MRLILLIISLILYTSFLSAQNPVEPDVQAKVEVVTDDPAFSQSVIGICARTADGKTLVDINAEVMMLPASNNLSWRS